MVTKLSRTVLGIIFIFNFVPLSSAQELVVSTLGDFDDVSVLETEGEYGVYKSDGSLNISATRREVTKEFYATHSDTYDFIIIFTNFEFQMINYQIAGEDVVSKGFYHPIRNDIQGIGYNIVDHTTLYGSDGKLLGTIDAGPLSNLDTNPYDPMFSWTMEFLSHELLHRWAAFVNFDKDVIVSDELLGAGHQGMRSHWSYKFNSFGSVLYGNYWQDNGDGTFTSLPGYKYYGPLDMYLMGLYDKSEVPPMLLIENPDINREFKPDVGVTISGTPRYVTIDDIIAAEGNRIPNVANSKKKFRVAAVLLTRPNTVTSAEIYQVRNMIDHWITWYSALTDGRGQIEYDAATPIALPANPGSEPKPYEPRTNPAEVQEGIDWLIANQNQDGSWQDHTKTNKRDTAEAMLALFGQAAAEPSVDLGVSWLEGQSADSVDYLVRKIIALKTTAQDHQAELTRLLGLQNPDGGFGSAKSYTSNLLDTSLALTALAQIDYPDVQPALDYLLANQNPDHSFGDIQTTVNALLALSHYQTDANIINNTVSFLLSKQNPDHGFGLILSNVIDTARVMIVLAKLGKAPQEVNLAMDYLLDRQSADGSWYASAYETALAVRAIELALIDPDLIVTTNDISFTPESVFELPTDVLVNVNVENRGLTDVAQARVVIYHDTQLPENIVFDQSLPFPSRIPQNVNFSYQVTDGYNHRFYVVVDPDNLVAEVRENNNIALKILYPTSSYDFIVDDFVVTPGTVDFLDQVSFALQISNQGITNANNLTVRLYIDTQFGPHEISTLAVDIDAGETVSRQVEWQADFIGTGLTVNAVVDPTGNFSELSEDNNTMTAVLNINSTGLPNLSIDYHDIAVTPYPAKQGQDLTITALVENNGEVDLSDVVVNFHQNEFQGTPRLIGSQTLAFLNAGQALPVDITWADIDIFGDRLITVTLDPGNLITEIDEDDNSAFVVLDIQSLPDLFIDNGSVVFVPNAPKTGELVTVNVSLANIGQQTAEDVAVRLEINGNPIATQTIAKVDGESIENVSFGFDSTGYDMTNTVTVRLDPDGQIVELNENNNSLTKTLILQNADLWLSETYISPNGDGVQDSTQFFFRLYSVQDVSIRVQNNKAETVRTYSGSEYDGISGGSVTWDGMNEKSVVVADGQYQIQVVDQVGSTIAMLPVVVDNNRSLLVEAIGTEYLLKNNLSCMLPDLYGHTWMEGERRLLLWINTPDEDTPEFPTGLYTVSKDGLEVSRIVPWEWIEDHQGNEEYYYEEVGLAPNGRDLVFTLVLAKLNMFNEYVNDSRQLWRVDWQGNHLTLLEEFDLGLENKPISQIHWSPDSQKVAYQTNNYTNNTKELWLVSSDGTQKEMLVSQDYWSFHVSWMPDSSQVIYFSWNENTHQGKLVRQGFGQAPEDIFEAPSGYTFSGSYSIEDNWIQLNLTDATTYESVLFLVDVYSDGTPLYVDLLNENQVDYHSLITTRLVADDFGNKVVVVCDTRANCATVYTFNQYPILDYRPDILLSPDKTKLALIDHLYEQTQEGWHNSYIVVLDLMSGTQLAAQKVSDNFEDCSTWSGTHCYRFNSMKWLAGSDGVLYRKSTGYYVVNLEDGLEYQLPIAENSTKVNGSPSGRFIDYQEVTDRDTVCYGKGEHDLWIMGSLLNLYVNIQAKKEDDQIVLSGTAVDLNFSHYTIEYAEFENPENWTTIVLPSGRMVIGGHLTNWVPPHPGTYLVRLSVTDLAGNTAWERRRVSWSEQIVITNLQTENELFSPNGDGVKDSSKLHYDVVAPVHLDFEITTRDGRWVRTIQKDYAGAGPGFIEWDGRDQAGLTVADGKYVVRIFDYEFEYEVDNTPPYGLCGLFDITIDEKGDWYFSLICGLMEQNLSNSYVEYGEGENPSSWFSYLPKAHFLKKADYLCDTCYHGAHSIYDVGFWVDKKFRLVSEDGAGNIGTATSDFLEEVVIARTFRNPDGRQESYRPERFADLIFAEPGLHYLSGFETVRLPIVIASVQMSMNGQWIDDLPVEYPESWNIELAWDNSEAKPGDVAAVRMHLIDEANNEHFSEPVFFEAPFSLGSNCRVMDWSTVVGMRIPFKEFRELRVQIKGSQDANYFDWQDSAVYDITQGDVIPVGKFEIELPEDLVVGVSYLVRMVALDIDGEVHQSNTILLSYGCESDVAQLNLQVAYQEAEECNSLSSGQVNLFVELGGFRQERELKTLSYFIEQGGQDVLLESIDLAVDRRTSHLVDTRQMTEGVYSVKAVLEYEENSQLRTLEDTSAITVDRVLPEVRINSPLDGSRVCPMAYYRCFENVYNGVLLGVAYSDDGGYFDGPYYFQEPFASINKNLANADVCDSIWNLDGVMQQNPSLMAVVFDQVGNVGCHMITVFVEDLEIMMFPDKLLFSPNGDGEYDDLLVNYTINEDVTLSVDVYRDSNSEDSSDGVFVANILNDMPHLSGAGSFVWTGEYAPGNPVADGFYRIQISALNVCGSLHQEDIQVEVDNTPPQLSIAYPAVDSPITTIVEVLGTTSDIHFGSYQLDHYPLADSNDLTVIAAGSQPLEEVGVLGVWNTYGLQNVQVLRLTARDRVANQSRVELTFDLSQKVEPIKALLAEPQLFSPNADGNFEFTQIEYELAETCDLTIEVFDQSAAVIKTFSYSGLNAGIYQELWDGTDTTLAYVPDGDYSISLTATLTANPLVSQQESITVTVDNTDPVIAMTNPETSVCLADNLVVSGSITDDHIDGYLISYLFDAQSNGLAEGTQNRQDFDFADLSTLADGQYLLVVSADDLAGNSNQSEIDFIIDKSQPRLELDNPIAQAAYGGQNNPVVISGSVTEDNLVEYSVRYGLGETPSAWTELHSAAMVPPDGNLFSWDVGPTSGLADGVYTLSVNLTDCASNQDEQQVAIIIDNTAPQVAVSVPTAGDIVTGPTDIVGSVTDSNLEEYTVELGKNACATANQWTLIKTSGQQVAEDVLGHLAVMPQSGEYCLKVNAQDKAGSQAEVKIDITIETVPPKAPVLAGQLDQTQKVQLTWTVEDADDIEGYYIYRNGSQLNASLVTETKYLDLDLESGNYSYSVTAKGLSGLVSEHSNSVELTVDKIAPDLAIYYPTDGGLVHDLVKIEGTAYSQEDFKSYTVSIGEGLAPGNWIIIRTSPVATFSDVLAEWDTVFTTDGQYSIKLDVEDIYGNQAYEQISVTVDNTAPDAPVLLSATPNLDDVDLVWQAVSDVDLAGYLLYRNNQLANVDGTVVGNLMPYLLSATGYVDLDLPDGSHTYYLQAMDEAGNLSEQSNSITVELENRTPQAIIVKPADGHDFEKPIMVRAEVEDLDTASVLIQYSPVSSSIWNDIGLALTIRPYVAELDPIALGLSYGDYRLRAVATDTHNNTDPTPAEIGVRYTELTPPAVPQGLTALVTGDDVAVSWQPVADFDLVGYNLYLDLGGSPQKVNSQAITLETYDLFDLALGQYQLQVTAVDSYNNESQPSESAAISIYRPALSSPGALVSEPSISIIGSGAKPDDQVDFFVDIGQGQTLVATVNADQSGNFSAEVSLSLGNNAVTVLAKDVLGNTSLMSSPINVLHDLAPATPTGFVANVVDHTVELSWDPNSEPDLAGYNLYRDGEMLNAEGDLSGGIASGTSNYSAYSAIDGNFSSVWKSNSCFATPCPEIWWQWDFGSPAMITSVQIDWFYSYRPQNFDLQAWDGSAWQTLEEVRGNYQSTNLFAINSYLTNKIRIYIYDTGNYNYVYLSEVKVTSGGPILDTSFVETLADGIYNYQLSAVDLNGLESPLTDNLEVVVGDVEAPTAPSNLTAVVQGIDIVLSWDENSEPDLAGYDIYRQSAAGPIKLNNSLLSSAGFVDPDLLNGSYTYFVIAVDTIGNQSAPSNSATAMVNTGIPPNTPTIDTPTTWEQPITVSQSSVTVAGWADLNSLVELRQNGIAVGQVETVLERLYNQYDIDPGADDQVTHVALSPDGSLLAYSTYDSLNQLDNLWLLDLETNVVQQVTPGGINPRWSPDGTKLAYTVYDYYNWYSNVHVYDLMSGQSASLTGEPEVEEYEPSWSMDGNSIAFVSSRTYYYEVWWKDLQTNNMVQVTNWAGVVGVRMSPVELKVAYYDFYSGSIGVFDLETNQLLQTIGANGTDFAWGPEGRKIAYLNSQNSVYGLYVFDLQTQGALEVIRFGSYLSSPSFSPDGKELVYANSRTYESNVWISDAFGSGRTEFLHSFSVGEILSVEWLPSGSVAIGHEGYSPALHVYKQAARFEFENVALEPGENLFVAVGKDGAENESPPSDEISVTYDYQPAPEPDLEILADNIQIFPAAPVEGELVSLAVEVNNIGQAAAQDVVVDVYAWEASNRITLVGSGVISTLAAGQSGYLNLEWSSAQNAGLNTFYVTVDPDNQLNESNEGNNFAELELFVFGQAGLAMNAALDALSYGFNQDVSININLQNSGSLLQGRLVVRLSNAVGEMVAELDDLSLSLEYGANLDFDYLWNTGTTLPGEYYLNASFEDLAGQLIAQQNVAFEIESTFDLHAAVSTDRSHYGLQEQVITNVLVSNQSLNEIISDLSVVTKIVDPLQNVLLEDTQHVAYILFDDQVNLTIDWNTARQAAGEYQAMVEVYQEDSLVAAAGSQFMIDQVVMVQGSLAVTPPMVSLYQPVRAEYELENIGNINALGTIVSLVVFDPDSLVELSRQDFSADLLLDNQLAQAVEFDSSQLVIGTYEMLLSYTYQDETTTIARATFTILDAVGPTIVVLAPQDGAAYNTQVDLSIEVRDVGSGVDWVGYRIDTGNWIAMPPINAALGRHLALWVPTNADEGSRVVSFTAFDRVGNQARPISVTIDVCVPDPEICDLIDNDCDGYTDEELGSTTCGLGVCNHTVENCVNGVVQVCDPMEGGSIEVCDLADNDCDGSTDEELGSTTCGLGVCNHTVENCVSGVEQICDPMEGGTIEVCDLADNDCDGSTDEELGSTTCGLGVCNHTVENCVAGVEQICDPLEGASDEVCDSADNDCDGSTDEELGSTTCGLGICQHTVENCVNGVEQVCDPMEGSVAEVCDLADNDCDGQTDEELGSTTCGLGVCSHTVENCVAGVEQVCDPMEGSIAEVCDLADNDCDGSTDEELGSTTCGLGVCNHTVDNCVAGVEQVCDPMQGAVTETCDLADNDCDGDTDEELGSTTCGLGICRHTIENCVAGATQTCDPMEGAISEVCDSADNDCDGATDEELGTTTCGLGVCQHTVENCVAGVVQVCDPMQGAEDEVCDDLDNDCNGQLDDLDADLDGYLACVDDCDDLDPNINPGAAEITCDNIDNDCSLLTSDDQDQDADGWTLCSGDCNDFDENTNPGMAEIPGNGIDDDCDPTTPDVSDIQLPEFNEAICAEEWVEIRNNTLVASYNPLEMFPGELGVAKSLGDMLIMNNAFIAGDVIAWGNLDIRNNVLVTGDVYYGAGIERDKQAAIGGTVYQLEEQPPPCGGYFNSVEYTAYVSQHNDNYLLWADEDISGYLDVGGGLEVANNAQVVLPGGTFYLSRLEVKNNAEVYIADGEAVVLVVENEVVFRNNSSIANDPNYPERLYVITNADSIEGEEVTVQNNAAVGMYLYAPYAEVELMNNDEIYGGIIGRRIWLKNNSVVYQPVLELAW
jgi:Tol biopolymer transport system component/subtilase family serine protease/fibronectin type 3 domain-containing protein